MGIAAGRWHIVVASPPCNTFSRALFHDAAGPRPLRSRSHSRGKPDLHGADLQKVGGANALCEFSIGALAAQVKRSGLALLEFPEDLGDAPMGRPASLWQWETMRALADLGLTRGATHQCEWAPVDYSKPTGLITNVHSLISNENFHIGWPIFKPANDEGSGKLEPQARRPTAQPLFPQRPPAANRQRPLRGMEDSSHSIVPPRPLREAG